MAIYLELRKDGELAHLANSVDPAIAQHMGVKETDEWACGWYQSIGLLMATGRRGKELRQEIATNWKEWPERVAELTKIADFIESSYEIYSYGM